MVGLSDAPRFPLPTLLRATWRHLEGQRSRLALFYLLAFASQAVGLLRPLALGGIFAAVEGGLAGLDPPLLEAMGLYLAAALGFVALHAPSRLLERRLAFVARRQFWRRTYGTLVDRPLGWHEARPSGATIDRARRAADGLFGFVGEQFRWIQTLMGLAGPIVMLVWLSWPVALVAAVVNLSVVLGVGRIDRVIVRAMARENEAGHRFSALLFDYVAHMSTLLGLRLGPRSEKEIVRVHEEARAPYLSHVGANELKYASISGALALLEVAALALFVVMDLEARGHVRIGVAVAVFRYANVLGRTFYEAAYTYQDLLRKRTDLAAAKLLFEPPPPPRRPAVAPADWEELEVSGLSHRYPGSEVAGLEGVSFALRRGEKVALVGPSGAGKSTVLAALRGLLEPDALELRLDGRRLDDLSPARAGIVLVGQTPELFASDLRFNLTGGLETPPGELEAALHDACLDRMIARLPRGLDTDVRESGVNLSGGERQRVALARALLLGRRARLLLLDEATSSVDRETEAEIFRRLLERWQDRTVLASVHGVHLLPGFDRVLELDGGRLREMRPRPPG